MDQSINLVPLLCLHCNTVLPAELDETAWVCPQCGQGMFLDEEKGLAPLQVYYSTAIQPNAVGKPYWVVQGRVTLNRQAFKNDARSSGQSQDFWGETRSFFVPAFQCTLENMLTQATNLLLNPPPLQAGERARFEPVTLSVKDIQPAAEFIVMATEAARPDKLKSVEFSLQLSTPVLCIFP